MLNCTQGTIDDSNFSKPMPIIGLYIAGATLLTAILMLIDLVKGSKSKQFWIPCNYFPINAATLTVIAVAVKLSVDLGSPMPSKNEQLAKLATSAYLCIVLANSMPSFAKMEKGELRANMIALVLLIITSIVNLCIQLKTGAILAFRKAHIFITVMMFLNLKVCLATADYVGSLKHQFQPKFEKQHRQILEESFNSCNASEKVSTQLEEYLRKFSMMAQSSCPHFLLSRSEISLIALAYGLMPASALLFVVSATITHQGKMVGLNTCNGESDYGWSVLWILITQAIAIVTGLAALLCRTIYYIKAFRAEFPVLLSPCSFLSLVLVSTLCPCLPTLPMDVRTNSNSPNQEPNSLRPYFLHWEAEEEHIDFMVETCSRLTQKYFDAEKARGPKHLKELLEHHLSPDFRGVLIVEKYQVPPICSSCFEKPTNFWAIHVLTLTCIATALPGIYHDSKGWLRKSVSEGLAYVRLVQENLNGLHPFDVRVETELLVQQALIRKCSWTSVDLEKLAHERIRAKDVLSSLADTAKEHFSKIVGDSDNFAFENLYLPTLEAMAAYFMYKLCQNILLDCQNENNLDPSSDEIFEKLCVSIADILGACLANLKQYILKECKRSNMEKRRETAFRMLKFFGKTKGIFEILEQGNRRIPQLSDEKMASIDEWYSYLTGGRT